MQTDLFINGERVAGEAGGIPELPWASMRGSGSGCDMSVYSLDAYTVVRHVMVAQA